MNAVLWALGAAVLAVALGIAAEFIARAWLARRGRAYVWAPFTRLQLELDLDALPMLEPIARWEINADGERGSALPDSWKDTYRVLVTGGSAAECYFIDQAHTWPEILGRELRRPESLRALGAQGVHVGNIARSLVACEEVDYMVEHTLDRYERLDLVVLMAGGSDLVHWLERGTPVPVLDSHIPPGQVFTTHASGPFGWGPKTLALRRVASYWNKRLRRPLELRLRAGKRLIEARAMRARAQEMLREVADPGPMLDHYEKHLTRLVTRFRQHGARVILARQAWLEGDLTPEQKRLMWNFGRGRPYSQDVTTYYDLALVWRLLQRVDQRTQEVARKLGVEQVEVNALVPRDFEHYYDELHFTPRGCELIGQGLARAVMSQVRAP